MEAAVVVTAIGCSEVARAVARAHLVGRGALSRALRLRWRGVGHRPIVHRGGVGGKGAARALHDPISLRSR
eukprot:scaffold30568_cov36-Tisochrysis_lutea.AAC.1